MKSFNSDHFPWWVPTKNLPWESCEACCATHTKGNVISLLWSSIHSTGVFQPPLLLHLLLYSYSRRHEGLPRQPTHTRAAMSYTYWNSNKFLKGSKNSPIPIYTTIRLLCLILHCACVTQLLRNKHITTNVYEGGSHGCRAALDWKIQKEECVGRGIGVKYPSATAWATPSGSYWQKSSLIYEADL